MGRHRAGQRPGGAQLERHDAALQRQRQHRAVAAIGEEAVAQFAQSFGGVHHRNRQARAIGVVGGDQLAGDGLQARGAGDQPGLALHLVGIAVVFRARGASAQAPSAPSAPAAQSSNAPQLPVPVAGANP